jgi:hypothetical protein
LLTPAFDRKPPQQKILSFFLLKTFNRFVEYTIKGHELIIFVQIERIFRVFSLEFLFLLIFFDCANVETKFMSIKKRKFTALSNFSRFLFSYGVQKNDGKFSGRQIFSWAALIRCLKRASINFFYELNGWTKKIKASVTLVDSSLRLNFNRENFETRAWVNYLFHNDS